MKIVAPHKMDKGEIDKKIQDAEQYAEECFFTVCNYEQVLRDLLAIERTAQQKLGQQMRTLEQDNARLREELGTLDGITRLIMAAVQQR